MTGDSRLDRVRRWLRLAQSDLNLAELIAIQLISEPRQACFHAQQAVEKALKAALQFESLRVERTHDLDDLRDSLPLQWAVKGSHPSFAILKVWAVEARYVESISDPVDADAQLAVQEARAVWVSITADLKQRGFDVTAELT